MNVDFVLRAADRGHIRLVSTGPNASYVAGHPDGVITRHSSFNFADYQTGIAGFGKIRVFGEETFSANGTGYNMHPHHNFIIMAVILDGTLTHINTIGKIDTLSAGDYYIFSTGSGGKHCELNIEPGELRVIYVWLLPGRLMTPPSYHRAHYAAAASAGRIACLVGDEPGALPIGQDAKLCRLAGGCGQTHAYRLAAGHGAYVFVLEGAAEICGASLARRDSIGLSGGDRVDVAVAADATDLLLVDTPL